MSNLSSTTYPIDIIAIFINKDFHEKEVDGTMELNLIIIFYYLIIIFYYLEVCIIINKY